MRSRAERLTSNPELMGSLMSSFGNMMSGQNGGAAPDLSSLASMFGGAAQGQNQNQGNTQGEQSDKQN